MHDFSPSQDYQIRQAIFQAGQQAIELAAQQFQVLQKGPDDFVTSVDLVLDRQLTGQFAAWFPEDGIISEENPASREAFHGAAKRLWLIDPLDGTDDFIHGKSDYAIMVGLLQDHHPVAGWVYLPAQDQLYFGGSGWGLFQSFKNTTPQELVPTQPAKPASDFCPLLIGYKDQLNYGTAIRQVIPEAQFQSRGSFGYKVIEVIQGQAGLYLYLNGRVKLWDTTGPMALAEAAGLICCDLDGQPIRFTADVVEPDTLTHKQPILIGWPHYIESLQPRLAEAVSLTTA